MSIRPSILAILLTACAVRPPADDATDGAIITTTTTGTVTTTGPGPVPTTTAMGTTSSSTTGPATTSTSEPATTADNFITPPDGGGGIKECDPWLEDCPAGQKCNPFSNDGDNSWESLKCVDLVPEPDGVGEPCDFFDGPLSGKDSCDFHMMCWNYDADTGKGTCVAKCIGGPEAPDCADPSKQCLVTSDAILILCLPMCHPLLQDCPGVDLCIVDPQSGDWICALDASDGEGQVFDACEYANACDRGLLCQDPAFAVECDPQAGGCCLPLCDLALPNTCPGQGQACVPWYAPGEAPPDYEDVGLCRLPPP